MSHFLNIAVLSPILSTKGLSTTALMFMFVCSCIHVWFIYYYLFGWWGLRVTVIKLTFRHPGRPGDCQIINNNNNNNLFVFVPCICVCVCAGSPVIIFWGQSVLIDYIPYGAPKGGTNVGEGVPATSVTYAAHMCDDLFFIFKMRGGGSSLPHPTST